MDDLISRQAALDALIKLSGQRDAWDNNEGYAQKRGIDASICAIEDLPSAERRGRWVDLKCDQCGQVDMSKPNYCPNCGAKMDEKVNASTAPADIAKRSA